MDFIEAVAVVATLALSTTFVLQIIKMALSHHEKIERIRHGYPLDGFTPAKKTDDVVDYRTDYQN